MESRQKEWIAALAVLALLPAAAFAYTAAEQHANAAAASGGTLGATSFTAGMTQHDADAAHRCLHNATTNTTATPTATTPAA